MIYEICLFLTALGILGLAAQMLLGLGHFGHAGHHGPGVAGHGHGASHGHGSAGQHHHNAAPARGNKSLGLGSWLVGLLSPLSLFSLCVGAGVTGLAVRGEHWTTLVVGLLAACGGIGFTLAVVRPIYALLFRFASQPSTALEGTLGTEAEVTTPFDQFGRGIVSLTLDGQLVRVLATLDDTDRAISAAIRPGEKLTVTSIDARANSCRVARL